MKKEIIRIEIQNMRKYQTRTDIKSMNYLRVSSRIFEDPEFHVLSVQGKLLWFVILGLAAVDNNATVALNPRYIAAKHGLEARWIRASILKYEEFGWVKTLSRDVNVSKLSKVKESKVKLSKGKGSKGQTAQAVLPAELVSKKISGAEEIFKIYNAHRGELPLAKTLSKSRREKATARWKENPDKNYWAEVFEKAGKSSFLTGKTDRGWKANFDWLIKNEENSLKVIEGAYDRGKKISAKNQGTIEELNERHENGYYDSTPNPF